VALREIELTLFAMCIVSMPAISARADRNDLKPSIGRTMREGRIVEMRDAQVTLHDTQQRVQ
jgi:hypothetical protein